jgi:hypothetical protein
MIYVYEFYHKPTPALPQGRMTIYASGTCVFEDGENPYGQIPGRFLKFEQIIGTGLGYPMLSNLLPVQELLDHSFSASSAPTNRLQAFNLYLCQRAQTSALTTSKACHSLATRQPMQKAAVSLNRYNLQARLQRCLTS